MNENPNGFNVLVVSADGGNLCNRVGLEIARHTTLEKPIHVFLDHIPTDNTSPEEVYAFTEKSNGHEFDAAAFINLPDNPKDPEFISIVAFCCKFTMLNRRCVVNYHGRNGEPITLFNTRQGGYKNVEYKTSNEPTAIAADLWTRLSDELKPSLDQVCSTPAD